MADHATVERRSLRYHKAIAGRMERDPAIAARVSVEADLCPKDMPLSAERRELIAHRIMKDCATSAAPL